MGGVALNEPSHFGRDGWSRGHTFGRGEGRGEGGGCSSANAAGGNYRRGGGINAGRVPMIVREERTKGGGEAQGKRERERSIRLRWIPD